MRSLLVVGLASLCVLSSLAQTPRRNSSTAPLQPAPASASPFPLQLEARVPFAPTAFASEGRKHLLYELHLTNFGSSPLAIRGIEVIGADPSTPWTITTFTAPQLETMVQYTGGQETPHPKDAIVLAAGQRIVIFMAVDLDHGVHLPGKLRHRILTTSTQVEGAVISTSNTTLHVLHAPVTGPDWLAADGPDNDPDNHHRRGLLLMDGNPVISRRYAIDWKRVKDGASFTGDSRDVHSYYSYGEPVFAVAEGRVITSRDGLPDNIPGHNENFHPAVPITLDTITGNTITLALADGQFAYYMHLQPGSLRVHAGDHVHRGQLIARIGGSGDAREPHLHFEVTNAPKPLVGEGVPYLIDHYSSKNTDGTLQPHLRELPLNKTIVFFDERRQ